MHGGGGGGEGEGESLTLVAVEAVKSSVVAVAPVVGVAVDALAAVATGDAGVQTRPCAVSPDPHLFVDLPLQVDRHAVEPQPPQAAQERPQRVIGSTFRRAEQVRKPEMRIEKKRENWNGNKIVVHS